MRLAVPDPTLAAPDTGIELRPWIAADVGALAAAWNDPEIVRWCAVPSDAGPERARRWIAGWQERLDRGLALDLAVERDGAVVGEVGLVPLGPRAVELGWWTAPAARGQGVASVAVRLLADWALTALDVDRLAAEVPAGNPASAAVARRAGFAADPSPSEGAARWTRVRV